MCFQPWGILCHDSPLCGLVQNPVTPTTILVRLAASAGLVCHQLPGREDLPQEATVLLAAAVEGEGWSEYSRTCLAAQANLAPSAAALLARSSRSSLRCSLAGNQSPVPWGGGVSGTELVSRELFDVLAGDPDRDVRLSLARNRWLPEDLRIGFLGDADPWVVVEAATRRGPVSIELFTALLPRLTVGGRYSVLSLIDGLLPTRLAHRLVAEHSAGWEKATTILDGLDHDLMMGRLAEVAELDDELTAYFLSVPLLRKSLAVNPTLPGEYVVALADDPDDDERQAFQECDDIYPGLRDPAQTGIESGDADKRGLDNYGFDKPDPWDLMRDPKFPAEAAIEIATAGEITDRGAVAVHPGLPLPVIESLLACHGTGYGREIVRQRAAMNPALPVSRLIELLATDDPALTAGAAANPNLPVLVMYQLLDRAGL